MSICAFRPVKIAAHSCSPAACRSVLIGRRCSTPRPTWSVMAAVLFGHPTTRQAWSHARSYTESCAIPLRVRLRLEQTASEIHGLCWESLQDPFSGRVLCLEERILFSRFIDSINSPPLRMPLRTELRGLVVVANPSDLASYGMAAIDTAREVRQAQVAFDNIPLTIIDGRAGRPRATLATLMEQLTSNYHILYLVCHGAISNGESYLWLEDEHGRTALLPARVFAARIERLLRRPVLIILAACESGGQPHNVRAMLPLGALLAKSGVGAVLAMNGTIAVSTLRAMMAVFFRVLRRNGHIDAALATARAAIGAEQSWWMPVLWTRMRNGMLWQEPCAATELSWGAAQAPRLFLETASAGR
jgi:CHAT domain